MNKPVPTQIANRPLHPRAAVRQRELFRTLNEELGTGTFFEDSKSMIDKLRLLASEHFKFVDKVAGRTVSDDDGEDLAEGYR